MALCMYFAAIGMAGAQESLLSSPEVQWQLTFDVIKAKVNGLLEENTRLTEQYQLLLSQQDKLQQAIAEQSKKNEEIRKFLKERGGKTDQQVHIEGLEKPIKTKKVQLPGLTKDANALKAKAAGWQNALNTKQLKISEQELHQNEAEAKVEAAPEQVPVTSGDAELDSLRKDLESQKAEEAALESQLAGLSGQSFDAQLNTLQQKVEALQQEKKQLLQAVSASKPQTPSPVQYAAITVQKSRLEEKIRRYETQINELKNGAAAGIGWPQQRKQLIHEIAQADARNSQLREQINGLREDIGILQDQITILENKSSRPKKVW